MQSGITVRVDVSRLVHGLERVVPLLDRYTRQALQVGARTAQTLARTIGEQRYRSRSGLLTATIQAGPVEGSFSGGDLGVDIVAGGTAGVTYARARDRGACAG